MKVNLYYASRKIKTVKVKKPDNWNEIIKKDYKVRIIGHKDIFNKFIVTTYLRPTHLLENPKENEINLNCIVYGGAIIE